jgi:cardiolipin synthase
MNMDQRSLKLHKELMVWVYQEEFAGRMTEVFLTDMESCHEVTEEDIQALGNLRRFRNQAARLLSNVL